MDDFDKLSDMFKRFPGVGPRQARRMVYFMLRQSPQWVDSFSEKMQRLRSVVHICSSCFRQFTPGKDGSAVCVICANPARDRNELMIVEKDVDLENVERSGVYLGLYFVLGGTASLMDETSLAHIRLQELLSVVREREESAKQQDAALDTALDTALEIILACSTSPAGEETAHAVVNALHKEFGKAFESKTLKISMLGRGLSTGAELEYADTETLKNAFQNRK